MLIYFLNSLIVFTELRSRSQIYVCIKSVEVLFKEVRSKDP